MLAKIGSVGCLDFEKMCGGSSRTSGDVEELASKDQLELRRKEEALELREREFEKKRGSGK